MDYKKDLKHLYLPSTKQFAIVDVPRMNFLMIDGHGNPNNNPDYQAIMEALYAVAYTIKFAVKKEGLEFAVPPLEGLWWMENMAEFSPETKERWDWTMMIMMPEGVTSEHVSRAREDAARKKNLPALARLRFDAYHEGLSVQIMYMGAYADEGPTIARLHAFIAEQGCVTNGKHHEIYMGDPRRTAPEKLKTVIRQPIR
jgi:hypothetical protein